VGNQKIKEKISWLYIYRTALNWRRVKAREKPMRTDENRTRFNDKAIAILFPIT